MEKVKLTPEEKKALKRKMKLEKKKEKKRLALEKKMQVKIDYLERELKYGELTTAKREKDWKSMLMKISGEKMRKDLDYAWHNFERVIDAKDFTISLLLDEIKQSEEQNLYRTRGHVENIDKLMQIYRDRLFELKNDYDREIDEMIKDARKENDNLNANYKDSESFIKMMLAGLQDAKERFFKNTMGDYIARLNEESERFNDITALMKTLLQIQLENVWSKINWFLNMFNKRVKSRLNAHDKYNEADQQVHQLINEQKIKIEQSYQQLQKLKNRHNNIVHYETNRKDELLKERKFYADRFETLKKQLRFEMATDNKNLTLLSIQSNSIIDFLREIERKAERILGTGAVCRKYETQTEKVLPFPQEAPAQNPNPHLRVLQKEFEFNLDDLSHFWQRVAQADAVRYSMQEEIVCLNKQNDALKTKIHEYCECLNCPPLREVVDTERRHEEALIAENMKYFIDANQEVKKYDAKVKKK